MKLDIGVVRNYQINLARPVKVYRNLKHGRHTTPLYSVQQDGIVKDRVHRILLSHVDFIVNEAGRQRVLKEKRKNVHAFVVGYITDSTVIGGYQYDKDGPDFPVKVNYNPYAGPSFKTEHGKDAKFAYAVLINEHGVSAVNPISGEEDNNGEQMH